MDEGKNERRISSDNPLGFQGNQTVNGCLTFEPKKSKERCFEIKTGDMTCPLTGEKVDVMVKIVGEGLSLPFMSFPFLKQVEKMLLPFVKENQPQFEEEEAFSEAAFNDGVSSLSQIISSQTDNLHAALLEIKAEMKACLEKQAQTPVVFATPYGPKEVTVPRQQVSVLDSQPVDSEEEMVEEVEEVGTHAPPVVSKRRKTAREKMLEQRDKVARKEFAEELAELCNNPPQSEGAKHKGIEQKDLVELVRQWKGAFSDPQIMFPMLSKATNGQITQTRFDVILSRKEARKIKDS